MADAATIQEFLVKVGIKTDEAGLRTAKDGLKGMSAGVNQFQDALNHLQKAIEEVTKSLKNLSGKPATDLLEVHRKINNSMEELRKSAREWKATAIEGATGFIEALRRVGEQYEGLGKIVQVIPGLTVAGLEAAEYASQQVGNAAGFATSEMMALGNVLRDPMMKQSLEQMIAPAMAKITKELPNADKAVKQYYATLQMLSDLYKTDPRAAERYAKMFLNLDPAQLASSNKNLQKQMDMEAEREKQMQDRGLTMKNEADNTQTAIDLQEKLNQVSTDFHDIWEQTFGQVGPLMVDFLGHVHDVLSAIADFNKTHPEWAVIETVVGTYVTAKLAWGTLKLILGQLGLVKTAAPEAAAAVEGVAGEAGLLSDLIVGLSGPWGAIVIAAGAAVIEVYKHWDEIVPYFKTKVAEIEDEWKKGDWAGVGKTIGQIMFDSIKAIFTIGVPEIVGMIGGGHWDPKSRTLKGGAWDVAGKVGDYLDEHYFQKILPSYSNPPKPGPPATQAETDAATKYLMTGPSFQGGGIVNANLHEGEMVLPPAISEGLQRLIGAGAGMAPTIDSAAHAASRKLNDWLGGTGAPAKVIIDNADDFAHQFVTSLKGGGAQGSGSTGAGMNEPHTAGGGDVGAYTGASAGPNTATGSQRAQSWKRFLMSAGLTAEQAQGVLAGLKGESGQELNPGAFNPHDPQGGAFGTAQWVGPRANALKAFARSLGKSWQDMGVQQQYFMQEMLTKYKGVWDKIRKDPNSMAALTDFVSQFERPANTTGEIARRAAFLKQDLMDQDRLYSHRVASDASRHVTINQTNTNNFNGVGSQLSSTAMSRWRDLHERQTADTIRNWRTAIG